MTTLKQTQEVINIKNRAIRIATDERNTVVSSLHLLLFILNTKNRIVQRIIENGGTTTKALQAIVAETIREVIDTRRLDLGLFSPELTDAAKAVFKAAEQASIQLGDEYVSVEALLIGIATEKHHAGEIVRALGLDHKTIFSEVRTLRAGSVVKTDAPREQKTLLQRYTTDLTQMARNLELDPVIGMEQQIQTVQQILVRRTRNNPLLVAEPGSGKTCIVNALAQRIVVNDVPESFQNKQVLLLNSNALVAGTKARGELEKRVTEIIRELEEAGGSIILFLDDLHTLLNDGTNLAALLTPALSRHHLLCIAATTPDAQKKSFEDAGELLRHFQEIRFDPPSVDESISIMRGISQTLEQHHGVTLSDAACVAAVQLSDRYLPEAFLPEKAIDLLDEAAAQLRLSNESRPSRIDTLERQRDALRMEIHQAPESTTIHSRERLETIEEELRELSIKWTHERMLLDSITSLEQRISTIRDQTERLRNNVQLQDALTLLDQQLPGLQEQLAQAIAQLDAHREIEHLINDEVDAEQVAHVIATKTGIPLNKLQENEVARLMNMETVLHKRVIGQHDAILSVSEAVRRSRAGLGDPSRPVGSFLFLGPTGVGKTELAKALANFLFDDEAAMVRIDMSEYMEKHAVAKLIGAPPGYTGHDEGGQLTEAVRRKPYSVVLFDEIEKAHPDVFNVLLQVLDDGRLTDSMGRTVDFKNTVVIMTSNVASDKIFAANGNRTKAVAAVEAALTEAFKPEFLNRIDAKTVFDPLTREDISSILEIQLNKLRKLLSNRALSLQVSPKAKKRIGDIGYEPQYGARPLQRAVTNHFTTPMSTAIINGGATAGSTVEIDVDSNGEFVFDVK